MRKAHLPKQVRTKVALWQRNTTRTFQSHLFMLHEVTQHDRNRSVQVNKAARALRQHSVCHAKRRTLNFGPSPNKNVPADSSLAMNQGTFPRIQMLCCNRARSAAGEKKVRKEISPRAVWLSMTQKQYSNS